MFWSYKGGIIVNPQCEYYPPVGSNDDFSLLECNNSVANELNIVVRLNEIDIETGNWMCGSGYPPEFIESPAVQIETHGMAFELDN